MTIRIYPSQLPGSPLELHEWVGSISDFFSANGIDITSQTYQPVSVTVNGADVDPSDWPSTIVKSSDIIDFRPVPRSEIFFSIIAYLITVAISYLLRPSPQKSRSYEQGKQLDTATATANTAKLNQVVPELFGRYRRFPDYLTPPVRRFAAPREQWVTFLACIGPGRYRIEAESIKVGDTTFGLLGNNAEYVIFSPGDDVSGHAGHENWYSNGEVGGTSSGTAGIELTTDNAPPESPGASTFVFNGSAVSMTLGAWPSGWNVGDTLHIELRQQYTVTLEEVATSQFANVFRGDFTEVAPEPGMEISLSGDVNGRFLVYSFTSDPGGDLLVLEFTEGGLVDIAQIGVLNISFQIPESAYTITSINSQSTITVSRTVGQPWPGFPLNFIGSATITKDLSTIEGEWSNPFIACPESETTTSFEIDLFFPQGLCKLDDGDVKSASVSVQVEYRDANIGGGYNVVEFYYKEATLDQIGFTQRIDLAIPIRPEVRIRRIGAKSTKTELQDGVQWYGLRSLLATKTSYPGWTTIAIKLRGGGKISQQSENQINIVATRILPTLNPDKSWSAAQPTRDISAAVRYIADSIGYTDDNIDIDELARLHEKWESRGDYFDCVFDETVVKDAMSQCLLSGFSELTIDSGKIKPVRDEPRSIFEQSYSSQNTTNGIIKSFTSPKRDDNDGVQVEYVDASDSWVSRTVDCALPGSQKLKLEKITLTGVTDRTRAWRIGMRRAREQRFRRWTYSFSTELDALNSSYLSYVSLIDDVPGYGQSSIMIDAKLDGEDIIINSSENFRWSDEETMVVGWRRVDGTLAGPFTATRGVDERHIRVSGIPDDDVPIVDSKQEPPHIYFGAIARWSHPALVTQIKPDAENGTVSVTAVNYDSRIYADDDALPI
jgi:hypothetical protein